MDQNLKIQIVKGYIERVLALKEAKRVPSSGELKEIARELGMTEEDLFAAEKEAVMRLERGLVYLKRGRVDDAIADLSEAVALGPGRVAALHALATAHFQRFTVGRLD